MTKRWCDGCGSIERACPIGCPAVLGAVGAVPPDAAGPELTEARLDYLEWAHRQCRDHEWSAETAICALAIGAMDKSLPELVAAARERDQLRVRVAELELLCAERITQ